MGREFTSREAVLPLVYRVREDGLQRSEIEVPDHYCDNVCSWHIADTPNALTNVRYRG